MCLVWWGLEVEVDVFRQPGVLTYRVSHRIVFFSPVGQQMAGVWADWLFSFEEPHQVRC